MLVVESITALKYEIAGLRRQRGRRVAFVPTMGNLHAGHMKLMQVGRELADTVVASIYVNPLQFGENEDFAAYPRTPIEDIAALEGHGVDLLFVPGDAEIYPRGREASTRVEVPGLSDILCGTFRPGHFRGVTTVVNRLLNLVQPDVAVFGKKDYQQLLLIRLMVSDLGMPIEIVGADTVREVDGLALSSRNQYLSPPERQLAPRLYAALRDVRDKILAGRAWAPDMDERAAQALAAAGFKPDYVSTLRQTDLELPGPADRDLVILAAARLGRTRLIDNLEVGIP